MTERPIIFSGLMVNAILGERKSQTRRVAPVLLPGDKKYINAATHEEWIAKRVLQCPYGQPGDRLWVRETFDCYAADFSVAQCGITYRADNHSQYIRCLEWPQKVSLSPKWRPAIHMPRWASRIVLEISQVRVERVQEISCADCLSEGIAECDIPADDEGPNRIGYMIGPDDGQSGLDVTPQESFQKLWCSINSKRGFGWEINPWVWAISFKRVQP